MKASNILSRAPGRLDDSAYFAVTTPAATTCTAPTGLVVTAATGGAMTIVGAGGVGYDQTQSDKINTGVTRHYEIPLHCGWFKPSSGKYLPPSCSYVLELTLGYGPASLVNLVGANDPNYEITGMELKIPSISVQDLQLADRSMALRAIFSVLRRQAFVNDGARFSQSKKSIQ